MIQISNQYDYIECYLTLRCNLKCPYCINGQSKVIRNRKELTGDQWIEFINSVDNNIPVTIGGGEPSIHKDFYYILNNLKSNKIDLLTNLQLDIDKFKRFVPINIFYNANKKAYKNIRVSYHPSQMNPEELVYKAKQLQDYGYNIGIFAINHPHNASSNIYIAQLCADNNIYFFIKDFIGKYNNQLYGYYKYPECLDEINKTKLCKSSELLISPSGKIYNCHKHLYEEIGLYGSIDYLEELKPDYTLCNECGFCNPCDVKLKTNKDLNSSRCSIDIKNYE